MTSTPCCRCADVMPPATTCVPDCHCRADCDQRECSGGRTCHEFGIKNTKKPNNGLFTVCLPPLVGDDGNLHSINPCSSQHARHPHLLPPPSPNDTTAAPPPRPCLVNVRLFFNLLPLPPRSLTAKSRSAARQAARAVTAATPRARRTAAVPAWCVSRSALATGMKQCTGPCCPTPAPSSQQR